MRKQDLCPFQKKEIFKDPRVAYTCLAAVNTGGRRRVIVGTDDGRVLVYVVGGVGAVGSYELLEDWQDLYERGEVRCWGRIGVDNESKVGKKAVTEVVVDEELQKIFTTCDGVVGMHSLDKLEANRDMKRTFIYEEKRTLLKGVISTSLTTYHGDEHRLAAATRKRVFLYQYTTESVAPLNIEPDTEALLTTSKGNDILKVHLDSALLCICTKEEYRILDLNTGKTNLHHHDRRPRSLPSIISASDNMLLQLEGSTPYTQYVSRQTGEAVQQEIKWDASIEVLHVPSFLYLFGLVKQRTQISIFCHLTHRYYTIGGLPVVEGMDSIEGDVFLCAGSSVWQISPDPYLTQLIRLAQEGTSKAIDEALDLFNATWVGDDGREDLIKCHLYKVAGFAAFDKGEFTLAFEFFRCAHDIDPEYIDEREILSLYAMQKSLEAYMDGVRGNRRNLREVVHGLNINRSKTELARNASVELYNYLHYVRCPYEDPSQVLPKHRAVDTALLLKYLELYNENSKESDDEVQEILRDGNCLEFSYCASLLNEKKKYRCLALLKVHNGLVAEALQMLHELGNGGAHQEEGQNGVAEACFALRHCNGEDSGLVLEYLPWVLQHSPEEAVRALCVEREPALDPKRVLYTLSTYPDDVVLPYLEFLIFGMHRTDEKRYHTQLALMYISCIKKLLPPQVQGVMQSVPAGKEAGYLGDLRRRLKMHLKGDPMLYDPVKILAHLHAAGLVAEGVAVYAMTEQHELALKVLVYDMRAPEEAVAYCEEEYKNSLRKHIVGVLSSKFNSISFMRSPSPGNYMKPGSPTRSMSPRAELYDLDSPMSSVSPRHLEQDADICLDLEQAIARPNEFFAVHNIPIEDKHGNIFVGITKHNQYLYLLLQHCFYPEKGEVTARQQNTDHALRILTAIPKSLDPRKVLKLIPHNLLSVRQVKQYLVQVFRNIASEEKEGKILHNLALGNKHKHEVDRATLLGRCVLVDPLSRLCVICNKRLGTSGIAVYPNLEVAHYQCQLSHSGGTCPKTDLPFFVDVHNVRPRAKYWGAK